MTGKKGSIRELKRKYIDELDTRIKEWSEKRKFSRGDPYAFLECETRIATYTDAKNILDEAVDQMVSEGRKSD